MQSVFFVLPLQSNRIGNAYRLARTLIARKNMLTEKMNNALNAYRDAKDNVLNIATETLSALLGDNSSFYLIADEDDKLPETQFTTYYGETEGFTATKIIRDNNGEIAVYFISDYEDDDKVKPLYALNIELLVDIVKCAVKYVPQVRTLSNEIV